MEIRRQLTVTYCCFDNVEHAEYYCPGGFHPISIGDCFSQGRYRVIHKLGSGHSSTVWLARDCHQDGRFVALKAFRAEESGPSNYELAVQKNIQAADPPIPNIQTVIDHFYEESPNGTHLFLVYSFSGPSIYTLHSGRIDGTKRLRGDLARKVIKQLVRAVDGLHRAGVVHGDITCQNILFSLRPEVVEWTDADVYDILGKIRTDEIRTRDKTCLPPGVPKNITGPISCRRLIDPSATILEESIILADFGQSFPINNAIHGYTPATLINYFSPEIHFEERAGFEADVWGLACAIFEIRAGWPLFWNCFNDSELVLQQTVAMLGRLPDPWWGQFKSRDAWFSDDGKPKPSHEQRGPGPVKETSIREMLTLIGDNDLQPTSLGSVNPIFEKTGVKVGETEVELLGDLLENMLRYNPEDRIKLPKVMQHPYLAMCE